MLFSSWLISFQYHLTHLRYCLFESFHIQCFSPNIRLHKAPILLFILFILVNFITTTELDVNNRNKILDLSRKMGALQVIEKILLNVDFKHFAGFLSSRSSFASSSGF